MPEVKLNIYQKLAKIRKPVEILQKNKSGYGYKYVTEDLILSKITGLMDKYGVSLIPSIVAGSTKVEPYNYSKTKATKDGKVYEEKVNEVLVSGDMVWTWVNNENPEEKIPVPWAMVGQQADASQAFGSGLSYSSRYFLLKYFNAATSEDDPDNWRSAQKEAAEAEDREITAQIVEKIHGEVSSHLEKVPDDRAKIIDIIKKIARNEKGKPTSNYFDITDPVIAGNLLTELNNFFSKNNKEKEE
ncbi:MAG: ERF family protein [Clostridia bacterium]|nr:ERF family protein [Clostridia bacterium]